MFKQDTKPLDPTLPLYFFNDNETASLNLGDPSNVNLYSNLDQVSKIWILLQTYSPNNNLLIFIKLVYLKNYANGTYRLKLEYPRITSDIQYYEWLQQSNLLLDSTVSGYVPIVTALDASRWRSQPE